jgi:hypothetical protein
MKRTLQEKDCDGGRMKIGELIAWIKLTVDIDDVFETTMAALEYYKMSPSQEAISASGRSN